MTKQTRVIFPNGRTLIQPDSTWLTYKRGAKPFLDADLAAAEIEAGRAVLHPDELTGETGEAKDAGTDAAPAIEGGADLAADDAAEQKPRRKGKGRAAL